MRKPGSREQPNTGAIFLAGSLLPHSRDLLLVLAHQAVLAQQIGEVLAIQIREPRSRRHVAGGLLQKPA
jgi:hypothetical protein